MIGSALKKLAKQQGLTVDKGIAYGSLGGYAATLCEGSGWKRIVFSTQFADPAGRTSITDAVSARDMKKEFRVSELTVGSKMIVVTFLDNPGTMKRIQAFLDWFLPMLDSYGASGVDICPECGGEISGGSWAMVNGIAHHYHSGCAAHVRQSLEAEQERRSQEDSGSYTAGLLGSLLGAVLGAVVWAVVLSFGYIASLVGLLIGFLAEKGYNLFKGKQGKGKIAILILAVVFGVVLGTFLAESYGLFDLINSGMVPGLEISDIPKTILYLLANDGEYLGIVLKNVGMGLLFAALGVFALLRQAGKDVAGSRYVELK